MFPISCNNKMREKTDLFWVSISFNIFQHLSTFCLPSLNLSCFPHVSNLCPHLCRFLVEVSRISLLSRAQPGSTPQFWFSQRWQSWMPNETACTSGKGLVDSQLGIDVWGGKGNVETWETWGIPTRSIRICMSIMGCMYEDIHTHIHR